MHDDNQTLNLSLTSLPNFRKRRYLGDDLCLPLSEFLPEDQQRVRELYAFLECRRSPLSV